MTGMYISVADVKAISPSSSTTNDTLLEDVLAAVLRRIDRKTGQKFYGGKTGSYIVKPLETHNQATLLSIPRFESVTSVEQRRSIRGGWEEIDAGDYETSAEMAAWEDSGVDTIRFAKSVRAQIRVTGKIGWGHDDFTADPVPEDLPIEARQACRHKLANLPTGGPRGNQLMAGDMSVAASDWEFPFSVNLYLNSLVDPRRFTGGC